jgi:short chain dehydrogenase
MALIQKVAPTMCTQRSGHIINVSTIFAAGLCVPAVGNYCGSKAALETASQALAIELAPWNVRVTNYQTGPVMTELEREWGNRLPDTEDPRPALSDELYAWVISDAAPTPQSPDDVAGDVCRLVGSQSPGLAEQSGDASHAYVAGALRDPTRRSELEALLEAFARTGVAAASPAEPPASGSQPGARSYGTVRPRPPAKNASNASAASKNSSGWTAIPPMTASTSSSTTSAISIPSLLRPHRWLPSRFC